MLPRQTKRTELRRARCRCCGSSVIASSIPVSAAIIAGRGWTREVPGGHNSRRPIRADPQPSARTPRKPPMTDSRLARRVRFLLAASGCALVVAAADARRGRRSRQGAARLVERHHQPRPAAGHRPDVDARRDPHLRGALPVRLPRRRRRRSIPNTAEALPVVTDGGRTWTIRLKKGIRFTDDPGVQGQAARARRRRLRLLVQAPAGPEPARRRRSGADRPRRRRARLGRARAASPAARSTTTPRSTGCAPSTAHTLQLKLDRSQLHAARAAGGARPRSPSRARRSRPPAPT